MDWDEIWRNRYINKDVIYDYNGYTFENSDQYLQFILEICKYLDIKDNSTILDICCGNGSFLQYYIKSKNIKNCKIYGIDISNENIKYANDNYEGNYFCGDMKDKFNFDDNTFDYIINISSIQYLKNDLELKILLDKIKRVLKKDGTIFLGNIYDKDKCDDIFLKNNHYLTSKKFIYDYFIDTNIICYDNKYLDIDFYKYKNYKFNVLINLNNDFLNIGVDIHDTLTYSPLFFKNLFKNWKGKRFLITGTPLSKKNEILNILDDLNFKKYIDYDEIEFGFEYDKSNMCFSHFNRMKEHKLKMIKKNNIYFYFDDNPFYVNYLRNNNIIVFQTILSDSYINIFNKIDKYFTCNLQEKQFYYLNEYNNKKNVYIPGCFDLFHIGHLNLLNKYKNFNLYIGLQSDESIIEQKKTCSIMNINERIEFIKNLNIAKEILIYTNINQIDILSNYNINIFVIGPEYGYHEKHKETLTYCIKNNIEIKIEQRTENISSTIIKNRIKI